MAGRLENCVLGFAPALSYIQIGINDAASAVSGSTYTSNVQALITNACYPSGDVILADLALVKY